MDPRHLSPSPSISASPWASPFRLHLPAVLGAGPVALRVLRGGGRTWTAMVAVR